MLVQSLAQADLVDEYRLMVRPVIPGKGKLLSKTGLDQQKLQLHDTTKFPAGIVLLSYRK